MLRIHLQRFAFFKQGAYYYAERFSLIIDFSTPSRLYNFVIQKLEGLILNIHVAAVQGGIRRAVRAFAVKHNFNLFLFLFLSLTRARL